MSIEFRKNEREKLNEEDRRTRIEYLRSMI